MAARMLLGSEGRSAWNMAHLIRLLTKLDIYASEHFHHEVAPWLWSLLP
jgi:hypothetical protein